MTDSIIRDTQHHPENGNNFKYTDIELAQSIADMRTFTVSKIRSLSKNTPPKAFATAKAFGIIEENHLGRPPHGKARRRRPPQSNGY